VSSDLQIFRNVDSLDEGQSGYRHTGDAQRVQELGIRDGNDRHRVDRTSVRLLHTSVGTCENARRKNRKKTPLRCFVRLGERGVRAVREKTSAEHIVPGRGGRGVRRRSCSRQEIRSSRQVNTPSVLCRIARSVFDVEKVFRWSGFLFFTDFGFRSRRPSSVRGRRGRRPDGTVVDNVENRFFDTYSRN